MRARRKLLRGLEVYPYAREPLPLPAGLDPDHYPPAVYPNWDNTPRSGRRGLVLHGSSPEKFRPHVRAAVDTLAARPARRAAALGQVVERVGRGQPPRAGPASSATAGCRCSTRSCAVAGDDPLRIAMISYYLPSESKIGVGYQVHALATELAERGHDVTVLSACAPVPGARYGHRLVRPRGSLRTFRFATQLRRARPVRLRRPARPWRRLLDVAPSGRVPTSAPSTARASRRRCTSAGSWSARAWCCSGSARCWRAWSPTGPSSSRRPPAGGRPGSRP